MNARISDRWGAASGYLVFVLGIAAAAFERGAPPANAPIEDTLAFLTTYRTELLAQSLLFVLSAAVYVWFFASLRGFLFRPEGETGTISLTAFGAGVLWAGLQMVFQSAQVALASSAGTSLDPSAAGVVSQLTYALSVIAYLPMAVLLVAVAAVTFRTGAFPLWHGVLSAFTAAVNLVMGFGIVANSGPLTPGGALTYVLYLLTAVWLLATTTIMFRTRVGIPNRS